jgi:hypothetical protein
MEVAKTRNAICTGWCGHKLPVRGLRTINKLTSGKENKTEKNKIWKGV